MENVKEVKKDRIFAFDIMSIVAIMAVILIHVSSKYITQTSVGSLEYVLGCILNSISRFGAPLFFMISGALMLNEKKNLTFKSCLIRAVNLLILLFIWSLFYALVKYVGFPIIKGYGVSFKAFIYAFIYGNYHLWFLYVLIGLYLVTPLLRFIVNKKNLAYVKYFIALCVVFVYIPTLVTRVLNFYGQPGIFGFLRQFDVALVGVYTGYYVLGYYLYNVAFEKRHRITIYIFGVLSLFATVFGAIFINFDIFFSYGTITVFVYSMAVFVFIKELSKNKVSPEKLTLFSRLSFGVYLLHAFILGIVFRYLPHFEMPYLFIPLIFVVVTVITYGICFIISKIPFIKKLIKI